jgi:hypothetical protein
MNHPSQVRLNNDTVHSAGTVLYSVPTELQRGRSAYKYKTT